MASGTWAGEGSETQLVKRGDGRGDGGFFLIPERPVFAGVWIQPADRDVRRGDPAFFQESGRQFPDGENRLGREKPWDVRERIVNGREADREGGRVRSIP